MVRHFTQNLSLSQIERVFWRARFPGRRLCPRCNFRKLTRLADGRLRCARCGYRFGLLSGTLLKNSRLSLDYWYELLHWFAYGFTANRAAREIQLPQRLAHRCFALIREALAAQARSDIEQLRSLTPARGTCRGAPGARRDLPGAGHAYRFAALRRVRGTRHPSELVFHLYQKGERVYVDLVGEVSATTLRELMQDRLVLLPDAATEPSPACHNKTPHLQSSHPPPGGARGDPAPPAGNAPGQRQHQRHGLQRIIGFWGFLKQGLLKYHGVAPRHLFSYVKEMEFRFNHRRLGTAEVVDRLLQLLLSLRAKPT